MCSRKNYNTFELYKLEGIDKVLSNDMLVENILTYVIHGHRNEICVENLSSVRLVEKLWLERASKLLLKSKKCTYDIVLDHTNSLNHAKSVKRSGKELNQLVSLFSSKDHLQSSVLRVRLSITVHYFQAENYYSLLSFFTECGEQLKSLDISFPSNRGSMPVQFSQFSLPNLKEIYFQFSQEKCKNIMSCHHDFVSRNNEKGLTFLQNILNASSNLEVFGISLMTNSSNTNSANFTYLKLPEKITTILLENGLTTLSTDFLLQNNLSNLQKLMFVVQSNDVGNTMISSVLEHFRKTLKFLRLEGGKRSTICFPLMENLEVLSLGNSKVEINSRSTFFRNSMPKLKKIVFDEYVESWVTKFLKVGGFSGVEEIEMNLDSKAETMSVNFKLMECLHLAFPNLQRLSMTVNVNEMTCLNYVVQQLKQLKVLGIFFLGKSISNTTKRIESVLLGLPSKTQHLGLLNLSELRELHLTAGRRCNSQESSYLTDLLFQQGLQQMLNLQTLLLSGKFKPTDEMLEKWRKQGRFIEYREGKDLDDGEIFNPYKSY